MGKLIWLDVHPSTYQAKMDPAVLTSIVRRFKINKCCVLCHQLTFDMNNQHILDYLKIYSAKKNVKYSVLIKGPWGVGKTTFLKKHLIESNKNFLYISLYGVKSIEEIQEKILCSKQHELVSDAAKTAYSISKIIPYLGKISESISIPKQYLVNKYVLGKTLIFDDIERSLLGVEELMGYINSFVEHKGIPTVLVMNEEEYSKKSENFKDYKEKLIGKEFSLDTNPDVVVPDIVKSLPSDIQIYSSDIADLLKNIYKQSELKNFRLLGQAVANLSISCEFLFTEFHKDKLIVLGIIREFVTVYIEHNANNINLNSKSIIENMIPYENKFDKYDLFYLEFFDQHILKTFILGQPINNLLKERQIDKIKSNIDKPKEDWEILWSYLNLDQEEFKNVYEKTRSKWSSKSYSEICKIIHIYLIFISLINNGIIQVSKSDLNLELEEYINYLFDNGLITETFYKTSFERLNGAYGLGWHTSNANEEIELVKRLLESVRLDIMKEHHLKIIDEKILIGLQNDISDKSDITHLLNFSLSDSNGDTQLCYLHNIYKNTFTEILIKSSRTRLIELEKALKYRYISHLDNSTKDINKEIDWLNDVMMQLQDYINHDKKQNHGAYTIHGYNLKVFQEEIVNIIENF